MEIDVASVGIIPVIVLEKVEQAKPLADALVAGDLPIMEITLRSEAGLKSIAEVASRQDVLVGAGTVLNRKSAQAAISAGARFIVSPGLDAETIKYCQSEGVPIYPGVCTPTEVQQAYNLGVSVVKFFPAEAYGGAGTLKALSGPFPMMKFLPTGGIGPANLADYGRIPSVLAVGGSWMVKRDLIAEGAYSEVSQLAAEAVQAMQQVRSAS